MKHTIGTKIRALFSAFLSQRTGSVIVAFAIMAPVIIGVGGSAMDFAEAYLVRQRLGNSLDAAALAATASSSDPEEIEQRVEDFFNANYPEDRIGFTYDLTVDSDAEGVTVSAKADYDTSFLRVLGIDKITVTRTTSVHRVIGANIELALVLDISNSMNSNGKIDDLIEAAKSLVDTVVYDDQSEYYSKVALVPYGVAVNAGSYADTARGAITGTATITDATWQTGGSKSITGVTRANPAVVTAPSHGLVAGNKIWISGVSGMTQLNNKPYIVGTVINANSFQLKNYSGSNLNTSSGYSSYTSGGIIRKCAVSTVGVNGCEIQVTAANHGLSNGDYVVIKNVAGTGITTINTGSNSALQVSGVTTNTFVLPTSEMMPSGTNPAWSYTSGGSTYCTNPGCEYYRFTSATGSTKVFQVSSCVSERPGAYAYEDDGPDTAYVGPVYPPSSNSCLDSEIVPLSSDKEDLKDAIDNLEATGSTGGQVGIAWGWYMVSPNFGAIFPADSRPAAYDAEDLHKIVVIMTDGELNSPYYTGVVSRDATSGSGSSSDHINHNSSNGSPYTQGELLCDAMKAAPNNIEIYTIGFQIDDYPNGEALMQYCASGEDHFYKSDNGEELKQAFADIAKNISELYLSK